MVRCPWCKEDIEYLKITNMKTKKKASIFDLWIRVLSCPACECIIKVIE
jgi:hypothetical protein